MSQSGKSSQLLGRQRSEGRALSGSLSRSLSRLHDGILLTQRRFRQARLGLPFPIDPIEAIVVSHLAYDRTRIAKDFSKLLGLSGPSMSRLLAKLCAEGYLEQSPLEADRRVQALRFTPLGESLAARIDQLNARIAEIGTAALSSKERSRFVYLLREFNTGLGVPREILRSGEHELVPEQRRLVIASGMLGGDYFGTRQEIWVFQLFVELESAPEGVVFSKLNECIPISISRLSRLLSKLEEEGLIEKRVLENNRRTFNVLLSAEGKRRAEEWKRIIFKRLRFGFENLKAEEGVELLNLLEKMSSLPLVQAEDEEFGFSVCQSETEYYQARGFLLEHLVRNNQHMKQGSQILPESSFVAVKYEAELISALLEVRFTAKRAELFRWCYSKTFSSREKRLAFLRGALARLASVHKVSSVAVLPSVLSPEEEEELEVKSGRLALA